MSEYRYRIKVAGKKCRECACTSRFLWVWWCDLGAEFIGGCSERIKPDYPACTLFKIRRSLPETNLKIPMPPVKLPKEDIK